MGLKAPLSPRAPAGKPLELGRYEVILWSDDVERARAGSMLGIYRRDMSMVSEGRQRLVQGSEAVVMCGEVTVSWKSAAAVSGVVSREWKGQRGERRFTGRVMGERR